MQHAVDEQDVIVVGGGLSGLATALTASLQGHRVTVLESADQLGGAAAYSGGMVWIPGNHLQLAAGGSDSAEEAELYVRGLPLNVEAPEYLDVENMRRWLVAGPEAARFYEDVGAIQWYLVPNYPDYEYPHVNGSKLRGRFLGATFPGSALGPWQDKLRVTPHYPMGMTFNDLFAQKSEEEEADGSDPLRLTTFGTTADSSGQGDLYTFGTGLVAGVLARLVQEDVSIRVQSPVNELIVADDQVVGVRGTGPSGAFELKGAVVLATSGFDWDPELVKRYWGIDQSDFGTIAPRSITGDSYRFAERAGVRIAEMPPQYCGVNNGVGYRVAHEPGFAQCTENALPHTFTVNPSGERFADDSTYWGIAEYVFNRENPHKIYMIWDNQHHMKYSLGSTPPGGAYPADMVAVAATLAELGDKLGIDGAQLEKTAQHFNELARAGVDTDFGRGEHKAWSALVGDPQREPNPCLGPVEQPPYFGMQLLLTGNAIPGTGIAVDEECRAQQLSGSILKGLYAVGSCAVFSTSGAGHGGGFALSRAIAMSYIVGRRLADDGVPRSGTAGMAGGIPHASGA
jgi:3-oxosteroid 1-dehydrogenase